MAYIKSSRKKCGCPQKYNDTNNVCLFQHVGVFAENGTSDFRVCCSARALSYSTVHTGVSLSVCSSTKRV